MPRALIQEVATVFPSRVRVDRRRTEEATGAVPFLGNDWAEAHHHIEFIDEDGRRLTGPAAAVGVDGLAALHALVADHLDEDAVANQVVVGIEALSAVSVNHSSVEKMPPSGEPGPTISSTVPPGGTTTCVVGLQGRSILATTSW
ncbi:IS110 family transposase [Geodermatophilus africanus]|uniref:IS110 family transposase n=1 Tax=Geodermatophilus africanus TaxID=1137993 RepID=UPI001114BC5B|nr:IS110 family transposase [Geodermatophilus africanus]